jgi:hypothetical protein
MNFFKIKNSLYSSIFIFIVAVVIAAFILSYLYLLYTVFIKKKIKKKRLLNSSIIKADTLSSYTHLSDITISPDGSLIVTKITSVTDPTDSTSSSTGSINTLGGLAVKKTGNFGSGIYLPSNGATASLLSHYSKYTSSGNTWSGIWGSGITVATEVTLIRIGDAVILSIPDTILTPTSGTGVSAIITSSTGVIPSAYRNSVSNYYVIQIRDAGTEKASLLQINSGGTIVIYGTQNRGNFSGANGNSGFLRVCEPLIL